MLIAYLMLIAISIKMIYAPCFIITQWGIGVKLGFG